MKVRGTIKLRLHSGKNLSDQDTYSLVSWDVSDPWVEITLGKYILLTSKVIDNTSNPEWNESAVVPVCSNTNIVKFIACDSDVIGCNVIGEAQYKLEPLDTTWRKELNILLSRNGGTLNVTLEFIPHSINEFDVTKEPINLTDVYYEARKGGNLKLYNDAHDEKEDKGLWTSIYETFEKAEKFIYIAGWSLWAEVKMVREGKLSKITLGELLKKKASEGVCVVIMLWSEKFSTKQCAGLVGTFDKITVEYFSGSKVTAVAILRQMKGTCPIKEQVIETLFTHHSKVILADRSNKDIIAYTGGLDLTNGRWDTTSHTLWSTLSTFHENDFYNGYFSSIVPLEGPREPWHDVHCSVTGPVTLDFLMTFESRWMEQVPEFGHKLAKDLEVLKRNTLWENKPHEGHMLHTQLLQSIDSDSMVFKPSRLSSLNSSENHKVDISMHGGIVELIRSATKFIYIESQYFIGSSQFWSNNQDVNACNLIPVEIAEQICESIRKGTNLRVYIVIPLAPEGDPTSLVSKASINAILHWQFQTFRMMYKRIQETLNEVKSEYLPTDYLLLLCVVQRKSKGRVARSVNSSKIEPGSISWTLRKKRRFPIYVHSKLLISDDAKVIIGSANLNQRSLDGRRDTELSLAASQSKYDGSKHTQVVEGEVKKLRTSLWSEHTSGISETDEELSDPGSLNCIRKLKKLSEETMQNYIDDSFTSGIECRFMRYPLFITDKGDLKPWSTIPDLNVPVIGKESTFIPPLATT